MNKKPRTTREAARAIGVTLLTLQRWISLGKIRAPRIAVIRGRAARLWSARDIDRLRRAKEQIYRKGRGRKPRPKR